MLITLTPDSSSMSIYKTLLYKVCSNKELPTL